MSKEPKESSRHRQPHRRDSLTSVLSWAGLQPRSSLTKSSSTSSDSSPPSPSHHGLSRGRRHSSNGDDKKKARRRSMALRRFSISVPGAGAIDEDSLTKTKLKKTPSWTLDNKASESSSRTTTKAASTDAVNKTNASGSTISEQDSSEAKEEASSGDNSEENASKEKVSGPTQQLPLPPPPKPKSILRVASPDGRKPPPRRIPCFSTTLPEYDPRKPTANHACFVPLSESSITSISGSLSSSRSSICKPEKHGTATVRFATATVHRVEVGPGRRFLPVKRKSKSTVTYISRFDDENSLKKNLTSPTKQRRHRANQAAMGRYWQRTEEEEALEREEARKRAEQEAEQYRAEPSSPPNPDLISKNGTAAPPSPELSATDDKLEEIYVDDDKPESESSPRRAKRDASPASYRSSSLNLALSLPAPEPDTGFPSDDFSLEEELEIQQENYKTESAHIDIRVEAVETGRDWPLAELESEQTHQDEVKTTLLEIKTPRGNALSPIAEEFAIEDEDDSESETSSSGSESESDSEFQETTTKTPNRDSYQEPAEEQEHTPTMPPTPPRQSTALLPTDESEQSPSQETTTEDPNLFTPDDQSESHGKNWTSPRLRPTIPSKRHTHTHGTHTHVHGKHHQNLPSTPPASPPLLATKPSSGTGSTKKQHAVQKVPSFTIPILIPKITIGEKDESQGHKRSSSWGHRRSSSSSSSSSSTEKNDRRNGSPKRSGSPSAAKEKGSSSDRESSPGGGKSNRLHLSGRRKSRSSSSSSSGSGSGSGHHGHHGGHKTAVAV